MDDANAQILSAIKAISHDLNEVKIFEVRDSSTFIPMIGIKIAPVNEEQRYLMQRAGYSFEYPLILFGPLNGGRFAYDPYQQEGGMLIRTRCVAHNYVQEHWSELKDGDVIDVEYILGETQHPKVSEKLSIWSQVIHGDDEDGADAI